MRLNAIRQFLLEWCKLKLTLKAPPSPTGRLLELARLEITGAADEWSRSDSANARMASFAHHEYVMGQLSNLERLVLVASVLPIGFMTVEQWAWVSDLKPLYVPLYDLKGGMCNAPTATGHTCRNSRLFGEPRCFTHRHVASRPVTFVAPDGAEATDGACALDPRSLREARPLDDDPRRTRVIRAQPIYAQPTYIADLLGLAPWEVREAGRTGRAKLVETLLEEHERTTDEA